MKCQEHILPKHISPEMHPPVNNVRQSKTENKLNYTTKKRSPKLQKTKNSASHVPELPPFCTKYYPRNTY